MLIRTKYGVDKDGAGETSITDDAAFVSEVKNWLVVDFDSDDALIKSLIAAAIAYLDGSNGKTKRTLIYSEWNYIRDCFPKSAIRVPLPPSASVVNVKYRDTAGVEQTLVEGTDYRVNSLGAENFRARIVPLKTWPSVEPGGDAVKVIYLAGYGQKPSDLPENIKLVIKVIVAEWYTNRDMRGEVPTSPAFKGLMSQIKLMEI